VAHIAFDGLEQVGDEIGAPLELHVDARPALAHQLPFADEVVIEEDAVADDGDDDGKDYQAGHGASPVHGMLQLQREWQSRRRGATGTPNPAGITGCWLPARRPPPVTVDSLRSLSS
jgi:hypothetical protein